MKASKNAISLLLFNTKELTKPFLSVYLPMNVVESFADTILSTVLSDDDVSETSIDKDGQSLEHSLQ